MISSALLLTSVTFCSLFEATEAGSIRLLPALIALGLFCSSFCEIDYYERTSATKDACE